MISNLITGRAFIFAKHPLSEDEFIAPNPSLTITAIIFCFVGPFWLIGKFANKLVAFQMKGDNFMEGL